MAERALRRALAFRAREAERKQRRQLLAERVLAKRKRTMEAEARERSKRLKLRLKSEKTMTMDEIMHSRRLP